MAPHVEQALVAVCKAGASNNLVTFSNTIKEYRINQGRVFPRLVCNGEDFHQFALNHGADKTVAKIGLYIQGSVTIKDIALDTKNEIYAVNF